MELLELGLTKKTINAFNKKHIYTVDDVAKIFPRKYLDYRTFHAVNEAVDIDCAISGYLERVSKKSVNGRSMISGELVDENSGLKLYVTWFGQAFMWDALQRFQNQEVVVCGKTKLKNEYYTMPNPTMIKMRINFTGKIVPVYPKMKGISEEMMHKTIRSAIDKSEELLETSVVSKTKLPLYKDALFKLHFPRNEKDIEMAQKRFMFNDMLYFALKMKEKTDKGREDSPYIVSKHNITDAFIQSLPYELTTDQKSTVDVIKEKMEKGVRVNALVQGDVGCGKTVIAFACMLLAAENGYQSAIMAPTTVLAKQHYGELKEKMEVYGLKTVFLNSDVKGKEKKEILKKLKTGEIDFAVGTHSVFSKDVEYANLGLVVTDEEHRFGVRQREKLEEKAMTGAHVISMSATPIPRTIATVLYSDAKVLYTIKSMPNGRKPTQTAINCSEKNILSFVEKQIGTGRQCYVVCSLIEDGEVGSKSENLESVESTSRLYKTYFEPKGYKVGVITGKMEQEESDDVLTGFSENKYQILVSTTVIEVGVNVPNANTIIINNPERFGLMQLHQLRGRVGRSVYQGYCILKSADKSNERLQIMTQTTDGFEITKADLNLRGMGDLIGTKQSGENRYAELMIAKPNLYECVKKYVVWMKENNYGNKLLAVYEEHEELEDAGDILHS